MEPQSLAGGIAAFAFVSGIPPHRLSFPKTQTANPTSHPGTEHHAATRS